MIKGDERGFFFLNKAVEACAACTVNYLVCDHMQLLDITCFQIVL